jgi:hypothetical protein
MAAHDNLNLLERETWALTRRFAQRGGRLFLPSKTGSRERQDDTGGIELRIATAGCSRFFVSLRQPTMPC